MDILAEKYGVKVAVFETSLTAGSSGHLDETTPAGHVEHTLDSLATRVEIFHGVDRVSIETVAGSKWVNEKFWVNCPFKEYIKGRLKKKS